MKLNDKAGLQNAITNSVAFYNIMIHELERMKDLVNVEDNHAIIELVSEFQAQKLKLTAILSHLVN